MRAAIALVGCIVAMFGTLASIIVGFAFGVEAATATMTVSMIAGVAMMASASL